VLLHASVADRPLGIERAKAKRLAAGAGAACARVAAGGFVDGEGAATLGCGTTFWIPCSGTVASRERAVIIVVFDGVLELGDGPKTIAGEKSKLNPIAVNIVICNRRCYRCCRKSI
jgi:hypothetical protein